MSHVDSLSRAEETLQPNPSNQSRTMLTISAGQRDAPGRARQSAVQNTEFSLLTPVISVPSIVGSSKYQLSSRRMCRSDLRHSTGAVLQQSQLTFIASAHNRVNQPCEGQDGPVNEVHQTRPPTD